MRTFIAGAASTGPRKASTACVSTLSARPFASLASVFAVSGAMHEQVRLDEVRIEVAGHLPPRERLERLRRDERLRLGRQERRDVVPVPDEQSAELARLVGGDTTGYTEDHAAPRQHCAGDAGSTVEV